MIYLFRFIRCSGVRWYYKVNIRSVQRVRTFRGVVCRSRGAIRNSRRGGKRGGRRRRAREGGDLSERGDRRRRHVFGDLGVHHRGRDEDGAAVGEVLRQTPPRTRRRHAAHHPARLAPASVARASLSPIVRLEPPVPLPPCPSRVLAPPSPARSRSPPRIASPRLVACPGRASRAPAAPRSWSAPRWTRP